MPKEQALLNLWFPSVIDKYKVKLKSGVGSENVGAHGIFYFCTLGNQEESGHIFALIASKYDEQLS